MLHVSAAAAVAAVRISACLCLHSFSTGGKLFDDCQYCVEGGHNGAIAFIGTSQAKPSQAAAPEALDICIRSARTGRTLSPAAAVAVT